jgi:hypothetical protein
MYYIHWKAYKPINDADIQVAESVEAEEPMMVTECNHTNDADHDNSTEHASSMAEHLYRSKVGFI